MKAGTNLEKVLESGKFTVTAEAGPPKGTSVASVQKKGELLRHCCDAVNVTDNQTAIVRMSSLTGCLILKQQGIDPVMQMVVRDRNRLAIQSDLLGAVALGVGNVLCLSGDHQKFGNHPGAKGVFDIDSIQLIQTLKMMRDEKKFLSGEDINGEVPLFIGAAANPFADPSEFRVSRLAKKVKAGADFIQTQAVYDVDRFRQWTEAVVERDLDKQTHILAGVIPIKSAGMARYMRDSVPGVIIPDEIVTRMEQATEAKEEGVKIILEVIEQLKEIPGVHGIHIMAVSWEDIIPEVVRKAVLMPRPVL
ncbi:MAG: 5,10-methylenetetrahydrofolate reductase [Dehalococcoidales bacterium]|jgi:methylenetetrahydrofolate reductase (NADPH)|nr:5,10-methylenetetrahydrofolate reductase [Dehalococcoidales bacterium]MDP6577313.1 methylenetetrahydrofolate reductase [Dehalococcoidales bacterium]MDP6825029.1 methylenetetrahydrofolate reductase [Dehalococcoidales bacterium]|tara:strand:- start:10 stop:927 length:918 start_codon:yes stop_codon:yes gene_type:complete